VVVPRARIKGQCPRLLSDVRRHHLGVEVCASATTKDIRISICVNIGIINTNANANPIFFLCDTNSASINDSKLRIT